HGLFHAGLGKAGPVGAGVGKLGLNGGFLFLPGGAFDQGVQAAIDFRLDALLHLTGAPLVEGLQALHRVGLLAVADRVIGLRHGVVVVGGGSLGGSLGALQK